MVPLGMEKTIEKNMVLILQVLGQQERSEHGEAWMSGQMLGEATKLEPAEINDAVKPVDIFDRIKSLL